MSRHNEITNAAGKLRKISFDFQGYNSDRFYECYLLKKYDHCEDPGVAGKVWTAAKNLSLRSLTDPKYREILRAKAIEVDGATPEVVDQAIETGFNYKKKYPSGGNGPELLPPDDLDDVF